MRHMTLVEQMATYDNGTEAFTFTDAVPGRLTWEAGSESEPGRHFYRAANADESQWEIGVGDHSGGGTLTRVEVVLSSSGLTPINFSGAVKVSLIAPASAMWVVDSEQANLSALAVGSRAMAAGIQAEAYGVNAIALGFNAGAGQDFAPVEGAVAIGSYAGARHKDSVAIGADSTTLINEAVHHRSAFWWSKRSETVTSGATSTFIRSGGAGTEPSIDEGKIIAVKALVVAGNADGDRFYAAEISAMLRRPVGGVTAVLGTPTVTEIHKTGGVTATATIAGTGTGGHFGIQVTGETGEDWFWSGELRGVWV